MAVRNPTQYPPRAILEGTERGFVRFESGTVTLTELPQLRTPGAGDNRSRPRALRQQQHHVGPLSRPLSAFGAPA